MKYINPIIRILMGVFIILTVICIETTFEIGVIFLLGWIALNSTK